jgi:hypothetical protein
VIDHQVRARGYKIKVDSGMIFSQLAHPKCFSTRLKTIRAFEGTIHHRPRLDTPPTIFPTQRYMHCKIEHPKAFSAFRRTPNDSEASSRD